MIGLKVNRKEAERAKKVLRSKGLLMESYFPIHEEEYVIFPLNGIGDLPLGEIVKGIQFQKRKEKKKSVYDLLKEMSIDHRGFTYYLVGDIAIAKVPEGIPLELKEIGRLIAECQSGVRLVLVERGKRVGEFRRREYEIAFGYGMTETIHRENGLRLKLDPTEVFFDPKLSRERRKIAELSSDGERILVMFSGIGPYPLVIGKFRKGCEILGIEANEIAYRYSLENLEINKKLLKSKVKFVLGDVREVYGIGEFDRIVMPRPRGKEDFLEVALRFSSEKCTIHFYDFLKEGEIEHRRRELIRLISKLGGETLSIEHRRVGSIGQRKYRICFDFLIKKRRK